MTLAFQEIQHLSMKDIAEMPPIDAAEICLAAHKHFNATLEKENDEAVLRRMGGLLRPKALRVIEGGL